jgi:peptidoglycan/LPS O-acetylase OafA/YrhL
MLFWAGTIIFGRNRVFGDDIHFVFHLTFLQNWAMATANSWGPAGFAVTWSVAIEEQFYLVFPLIVYLTPRRHLILTLLSIGIVSCALRLAWVLIYPEMTFMPYVATPFRLDGLCAGGIVALLWRADYFRAEQRKEKHCLKALYVLSIGVPLLLTALTRNRNWHMNIWGHSYLTALYSLALFNVLLFVGNSKMGALRGPFLRSLGKISYGLYLYHPMCLALVYLPFGRLEAIDSLPTAALAMLGLVLSLLISWASFKYVEQRVLGYAGRFKYVSAPREPTDQPIAGSPRPLRNGSQPAKVAPGEPAGSRAPSG